VTPLASKELFGGRCARKKEQKKEGASLLLFAGNKIKMNGGKDKLPLRKGTSQMKPQIRGASEATRGPGSPRP